MNCKKSSILILAFVTGLFVAFILANLLNYKTLYSMFMGSTVFLIPNDMPGVVKVTVRDNQGSPISNVKIMITDLSGTSNAYTSHDGKASFKLNENIIETISVDDKVIVRTNFLKTIDCRHGLELFFVKNDSERLHSE